MSRYRTVWMSNSRRSLFLVGETFAGVQSFIPLAKYQANLPQLMTRTRERMFPQCVNKVHSSIWSLFPGAGTKS